MEQFQEKIEHLERLLKESIAHPTVSNSNNSNSNNITINMVSFGDEDFRLLTKEEIFQIIGNRFNCIQEYVQQTHLNDRIPAQQNVLVTNLRSSECKVHSDGRWVTRPVDEVIDEIVENGVGYIQNFLDETELRLSEERLQKLRDLLDKVSNREEVAFLKETKASIKRLLYDNKDKVKVRLSEKQCRDGQEGSSS
jgi:hypothetical protein